MFRSVNVKRKNNPVQTALTANGVAMNAAAFAAQGII